MEIGLRHDDFPGAVARCRSLSFYAAPRDPAHGTVPCCQAYPLAGAGASHPAGARVEKKSW